MDTITPNTSYQADQNSPFPWSLQLNNGHPFASVLESMAITRSITHICEGTTVPGLEAPQVALLLSCAYLTGWSAEKISNKIWEFYPQTLRVMPEIVWYSHVDWIDAHPEMAMEESQIMTEDMVRVLRLHRLEPQVKSRRLCETPKPCTIMHSLAWFPYRQKGSIFSVYDRETRHRIIGQLSWARSEKGFFVPVSVEKKICDSLGAEVSQIIIQTLRKWRPQLKTCVRALPYSKKLSECPQSWMRVALFGKRFKVEWEERFGKMDDEYKNHSLIPRNLHIENAVPIAIRSTGAAAKIFCCQMLVTRLIAFDNRRAVLNQQIAYVDVPLQDLPNGVTHCVICQEQLGKQTEEGDIEMPVRVIACCGNYFGKACLTRWYQGPRSTKRKCPLCNKVASDDFLDKLLGNHDAELQELEQKAGPMELADGDISS